MALASPPSVAAAAGAPALAPAPSPPGGAPGRPAIESSVGGEDPLDKANFDAVSYVNHHFPTERSLDRLDPFVVKVTAQISELDDHISRAVQAQSEAGQQAVRDVAEAKVAIRELFDKVRDIKSKAEQSEVMVQEICRDIRQLDYAKRHLQTTITALKRLHMLVTAVDQLQGVAAARQYREAANLLDAVRQLLTHFEGYAQVPRIAQLGATVAAIKADLSTQISRAFDAIGELAASSGLDDHGLPPPRPEGLGSGGGGSGHGSGGGGGGLSSPGSPPQPPPHYRGLTEACLVVDALGVDARQKQILSFCDRQLAPYANLFPRGAEQSSLENVERRFAWFRRLLRSVDVQMEGVFPAHWRMQHRLCMSFLERTRAALLTLLEAGGRECEDVQVLLKTLKRCLAFEKEAQHRFEADLNLSASKRGSGPSAAATGSSGAGTALAGGLAAAEPHEIDEQGNLIDPASAEGIKRKYARQAEARRRASTGENQTTPGPRTAFAALSKDGRGDYDEPEALPLLPIAGLLSGVFDPFMGPYIALERRNMDELMAKGVADDGVDRDGKLPVFAASVNIFAYIKNCTTRCTNLTTGQTFFNLHKEFKACLRAYANFLKSKLPTAQPAAGGTAIGGGGGGGAGGAGGGASSGTMLRIPEGGEVIVCYVINTSEYCAETLPQLEEMIRSKIEPSYKESVDLRGEQDAFFDVIAQAVRVLVLGLETRLDPAMRALSAVPWGACEMVGEESEYVRLLNDAVAPFIPAVRAPLSTVYFRNFCDKFATSFLPSYLNVLLRQRRINEMGTQQLLLDAYNIKTLMLKLPTLGADAAALAAAPVPVSYTKYVTKQMSKIEMVLKLVGTPDTMLAERFRIMWPDGVAGDLQAIMTLKGMRKADQQVIFDTLGFGGAVPMAGAGGGGFESGPRSAAAAAGGAGGAAAAHASSASGSPPPSGSGARGPGLSMPKLEQNTRAVARKMEMGVRDLTQNIGGWRLAK